MMSIELSKESLNCFEFNDVTQRVERHHLRGLKGSLPTGVEVA